MQGWSDGVAGGEVTDRLEMQREADLGALGEDVVTESAGPAAL